MTCEIGASVRWTEVSPTRLGYKASDIGTVISVRECASQGREIDVEFANGDVIRGAYERWFEPAPVEEPESEQGEEEPLALWA
jgi:hypothetical protein